MIAAGKMSERKSMPTPYLDALAAATVNGPSAMT
jgi:hypothetical protein